MYHTLHKFLPLALAFFAIGMFATASTIGQLSTANGKKEGVWVQLCATGVQVLLTIGGDDKNDAPMPGKTHAQACHACGDEHRIFKPRDDGEHPDEV